MPFTAPLALGPEKGKAFADHSTLFYYHAAKPAPDATPLLWAGDLPIMLERKTGKGSCVVFLGTMLGEPRKGETPFWQSQAWPESLGKALVGR